MPGIVGVISKRSHECCEADLDRMVNALRHESFYISGTWIDESSCVYVGWIARADSFSTTMPVVSASGKHVLVFSGEHYPASPLQAASGRASTSAGPSDLAECAEEDSSFPAGVNGRFHGLLVDKHRRILTLFNDRYGMSRLYLYDSGDTFYFAAEAKAILAVCPHLRTVDPRGLAELVSCGCVLENRTVFKDIYVLPPASAWKFREGALDRKAVYFQPQEWEQQTALDPQAYYRELRDVFSANLPRYFKGQPMGMSLTGGLDSRIILAWHRPEPNTLPCYSFGGMFRDCQDVMMARKVASICGQSHRVIPVAQDYLSRFAHYSERTVYLTDGCVDVSHSPDLYINEIARHIAPVRMTGNYGGEVLRRVRAFKPVEPPPSLFRVEFLPYIAQARETFERITECHPLSFAVFRQAPWHHYGLQALEQTQLTLRSPYLDNDFVRTVYRAPVSTLSDNNISLKLIEDGNPALRRLRTDRGIGGNGNRLGSAIAHRWLEFTFKAEYAYDYGMPHWVASVDHTVSAMHLERLFLGRHKFYHFRIWYRDHLANYIREVLLDRRALSRPYIEPKMLQTLVTSHIKGNRNYTTPIHKLLSLELMHRLFID